MLTVKFTDLELHALWHLADERSSLKMSSTKQDLLLANHYSSLELIYIGLKGEYAVCKFFEAPFDRESYIGADPGYDTTIGSARVQVKLQQNGLFWLENTDINADILIKVVADMNEKDPYLEAGPHAGRNVSILGWLSTDEFLRLSGPVMIGAAKMVGVNDKVLRPIWKLLGPLSNPSVESDE